MVHITAQAGALLQRIPSVQTLRLVLDANGPLIGASAPAADDTVLFHNNQAVLRLSSEASAALNGSTIAVRGADAPEELVILGPEESTVERAQE